MDLTEDDDWEYLPEVTTYHHLLRDSDDRDALSSIPLRSSSPSVFNMDYFSTSDDSHPPPTPPNLQFPHTSTLPVNDSAHHPEDDEDVDVNNNHTNKVLSEKESVESVDMKFLNSSSSPRSTKSVFEFDDLFSEDQISRSLTIIKSDEVSKISDDVNWIGEGIIGDDYVVDDDGIIGGLNLWKLGFGGFGAICSFGVAAATLCLILFGNSHKAKQNHKLRFQIYSADDQRMKQATNLNEAMSAAVRGVPLNRAHIAYGGYYDNAL